MTYETSVSLASTTPADMMFLDLVHCNISRNLPLGTKLNIFEPEICPDLIVLVEAFKDGFTVTFHIKSTGMVFVVGDAKKCKKPVSSNKFKTKMLHVMNFFHPDITWAM